MSLADARETALDALNAVAKGGNPASDRKTERTAAAAKRLATLSDLIEAYFADGERGQHRPNGRPKRAGTIALERYYFERAVKPRFGALPIADLAKADVQRLLSELGATTPAGARHCRNIIRQSFNYAIRLELLDRNPAQFVVLPRPASRDRVLTDAELRSIWIVANDADAIAKAHIVPSTGLALCLAMVTLQRAGEVCGLHAREIDRSGRLWTIPGDRTKSHRTHVVPLSSLALSIIDRATATAGGEVGFVFPSPIKGRPMTRAALSRAMKRVTLMTKIEGATPHDFRRTGSTNITSERIGMPRFIVSRVLNQLSDTGGAAAVTGIYDRNEYLPEKRRALNAWATLLSEIVSVTERPSNELALRH